MKSLLITLEYPPFRGGIAHYYANLVAHFPGEMLVLAQQAGDKEPELPAIPARLINPSLPAFKWLSAFSHIYRTAKEENVDCLIVGHLLPLGLPAYWVSKLLKKPMVIILHGLDFGITRRVPRKARLADWLLGKASAVICANHYTAELVKETMPSTDWAKVKVVNPGIEAKIPPYDADVVHALLKNNQLAGKEIILTVARLVARKGMDMIIQAMPAILAECPKAYYVIIGAGPDQARLEQLIKENNLGEHIRILNNIGHDEKTLWYQTAEIFALTARNTNGDFEGFGIVYLEAGLAGKPVVAGRAGGVPDAVADDQSGLLVDPESTEEISEAIVKLLKFPNLRERLGQYGRNRALKEFDWKIQAQKISDIISKIEK